MPGPKPAVAAEITNYEDEQKAALGRVERIGAFLLQWLKTRNPAATIDRLFISKHVSDLRNIVSVALLLLIIIGILCLAYAIKVTPGQNFLWRVVDALPKLVGVLTTLSAAFGAIGAWAYKVGSVRLGVVDLFGCEISTLCRVALVTDTIGQLKDRIERGEEAGTARAAPAAATKPETAPGTSDDQLRSPRAVQFTSAENYFPVFEGNTSDLQSLEARVVINITSFYTYMKAVRDLLRRAATLKSEPATAQVEKSGQLHADTWHNAMRDVIYMLFLGLEAGRDSVEDLVEFEPEQAERTIVILLSEFKAYLFLLQEFSQTDDIRERRLLLRWPGYQKSFRRLGQRVENGLKKAEDKLEEAKGVSRPQTAEISLRELDLTIWKGAKEIWPDLASLYRRVETFVLNESRAR